MSVFSIKQFYIQFVYIFVFVLFNGKGEIVYYYNIQEKIDIYLYIIELFDYLLKFFNFYCN